MAKFLDSSGLSYFFTKIKSVFSLKSEGVSTITRSGNTFTVTRPDSTTFTFNQQNTTYTNMTQAQATAGTETTARSISAVVLNTTIDNKIPSVTIASSVPTGNVPGDICFIKE